MNLRGSSTGYIWSLHKMERELEPYQRVERSIQKKFRKSIWVPFIAAVKRYELIQENDKIAVCISGGKDSMLMAKLLQELQKYSEVPFELVYLVMDPGYNELNRKKIESKQHYCTFRSRFLRPIFFPWQTTPKRTRAICVQNAPRTFIQQSEVARLQQDRTWTSFQ